LKPVFRLYAVQRGQRSCRAVTAFHVLGTRCHSEDNTDARCWRTRW